MDPHDVSSPALSLHSCPCSHIISLPHKQLDEQTQSIIMGAICYHCTFKKCIVLSVSSSSCFFLHSPPHVPPLPSLYIPHLCLLQPPLPLPLCAFLGEWVESSMGMWDPRRAGGVASYQSTVCVQTKCFRSANSNCQQRRVTVWCCRAPWEGWKIQNVAWIVILKSLRWNFVCCDHVTIRFLLYCCLNTFPELFWFTFTYSLLFPTLRLTTLNERRTSAGHVLILQSSLLSLNNVCQLCWLDSQLDSKTRLKFCWNLHREC